MNIFIDADGCPVVDITLKVARDFNIPVTVLCDTSHIIERENATTVTVEKGADSVDFKLVNMIKKEDIAVTQDYGLAAMCLAKGGVPINQNGLIFSDSNIEKLLFTRYVGKKIRNAGGHLKGPSKRTNGQNIAFEKALRNLLEMKTIE